MATVSEFVLRKILKNAKIRPFKVTYYCEKRDPDFDFKMHDVLVIYKQPVPGTGRVSSVWRDYEYVRFGTLSLLASIDLLTGETIPLVSPTHKSSDFFRFLKILDEKYPAGDKIRLILDNHSEHTPLRRPRNI